LARLFLYVSFAFFAVEPQGRRLIRNTTPFRPKSKTKIIAEENHSWP